MVPEARRKIRGAPEEEEVVVGVVDVVGVGVI
jgi:hypothetical protein